MSAQQPQTMARSVGAELSFSSGSMPEAILRRLVGDLECGELVIETPAGKRLLLKGRQFGPQARLQIHSWRLLGRLLSGWDVGFAEAYIAGECSSPNLDALLTLASQNSALAEPLKTLRMPRIWPRLCHAMNRNTRRGSRRNISAHYDLGNQFYEQWLDAGMQYSAALFSAPDQTLENAQDVKLDRVTSLLDLTGGESILEIGCGWGALAQRLLKTHDGRITGVTLSKEQLAYAQRRLDAESSANRYELRLQDYRDLRGTFDRIVSIEMLEAVGEAYWPTYFEKVRTCLRTGGTAVLQVITIDENRFANYRRRPDFIQQYIFPGGMLPTPRIIEREATNAGLTPISKEFFGVSYARTLEHWKHRFERAWPAIEPLGFDERFKRMWDYYLAYCEVGFATGVINVGLYKFARVDRA